MKKDINSNFSGDEESEWEKTWKVWLSPLNALLHHFPGYATLIFQIAP